VFESLKLLGIDTRKLLESGRKDIEALLETNEKVFMGAEALTRKQADLLGELAKEWHASLKDSVSPASGAEKLNQASVHAQRAERRAQQHARAHRSRASRDRRSIEVVLGVYEARGRPSRRELHFGFHAPTRVRPAARVPAEAAAHVIRCCGRHLRQVI
jgi:hypothetical protein